MGAVSQLRRMSLEEYFAFEEKSRRKHEFVNGAVYAMAGGSLTHNRIALNIAGALNGAARGSGCQVFIADVKLKIGDERVYYPDVMVTCDPSDNNELYVTRPCVLVEVLSPTTQRTDRTEKLEKYLEIPGLRLYAMVSPYRRQIEAYERVNDRWGFKTLNEGGSLEIPCLAASLSLDEVYQGIAI
ncbi:MAG: hypothetical protein C4342_06755 [Armatimonadota bacterium]